MKQIILLRRTEILKVEIEVIQPLAAATIEELWNTPQGLGRPQMEKVLQHEISRFTVSKAEPSCECASQQKSKKRSR